MDADEDRAWDPPDYENDDGEDLLGWDASGGQNSGFQPTLRDSGSHAPSPRATRSTENEESQKMSATQRLSQVCSA